MIKTLDRQLVPAYDLGMVEFCKLKGNKEYQVEIKQPRNYKFLQKFFALVNMLFENQETYTNIEDLREALLISTGYSREILLMTGEVQLRAKSISFASMKAEEFNKLYNSVCDFIVKKYGFDREDIATEIQQYYT